MYITSAFEGGNIELISVEDKTASLAISPDADPNYRQWFYFRCVSDIEQENLFRIENAGECAFAKAWEGCRIFATYDRVKWFRLPTRYDGKTLSFRHAPEYRSTFYTVFPPYTSVEHNRLMGWSQTQEDAGLYVYGESVEGRPLELIKVERHHNRKKFVCWIIARQHPGEPMAQWFVEGLLEELLCRHNAISRSLLREAVFYIVPNVNPDGSYHGYIRTNAAGVDLNRAWENPSEEKSPEIFHLLQKMKHTGVDFLLDVHGDENIPHVFLSNTDGVPSMTVKRIRWREIFEDTLKVVTTDFQRGHGYPSDQPGEADLSIGSKHIAENFNCLSLTLEQPFRDNEENEEDFRGWSPERSKRLGGATLSAIHAYLKARRSEE